MAELVSVSGRKAEFGQSFVFVRALLQYIKLSKRIKRILYRRTLRAGVVFMPLFCPAKA